MSLVDLRSWGTTWNNVGGVAFHTGYQPRSIDVLDLAELSSVRTGNPTTSIRCQQPAPSQGPIGHPFGQIVSRSEQTALARISCWTFRARSLLIECV
jgi:hypothetical protein